VKLERKVGDYATAAAAVQLTLSATGTVERIGIGLTNVGPVPIHAVDAAKKITGKKPDAALIADVAKAAAAQTSPNADRRGAVEYKREMARVLCARALTKALERAGGR
jgi:carbon-monoxide dehydrogenase medium subunit